MYRVDKTKFLLWISQKLFLFDWIKRNLQFNEKANLFKKHEKKNSAKYLFSIKNYADFIIEIIEILRPINYVNEWST